MSPSPITGALSSFMPPSPRLQKRQREQSSAQEGPVSKRHKTQYYLPHFQDAPSQLPLTRRALKDFNRRHQPKDSTPVIDPIRTGASRRLLRSDYRRLQQLASRGGPNLCPLRGYTAIQARTMSQSSSRSRKRSHASRSAKSTTTKSTTTSSTKTSTPCSGEFKQMLIDRGVLPPFYRPSSQTRPPKPDNIEEIRHALNQPRPSLSPSKFTETAFEAFQELNEQAASETMAMSQIIPVIAGSQDSQCGVAGDVSFTRLRKFDPELSAAKPDRYYGTKPDQIHPRVRRELAEYIVPSSRSSLPAAPNFFLEGKSSSGRADVAQNQAMYDGAHGGRGMNKVQNYGQSTPTYDGNAYTLACTYQPGTGTLQMYTTHPRLPSTRTGEPQYFMTQLDTYAMTGNINNFRSGAAAYRNGRDWAQRERARLIDNANIVAQSMPDNTNTRSRTSSNRIVSSIVGEPVESDTSADELTYDPKRQKWPSA